MQEDAARRLIEKVGQALSKPSVAKQAAKPAKISMACEEAALGETRRPPPESSAEKECISTKSV